MASETQSCEMFFQDITSEKNEKTVIFTKKKFILLIVVAILILGILIIPIYVHLRQEKIMSLITNNLTKISADIEAIKTNEIMLKEKINSKNSFAHFVKARDFGYFQKLEDEMSYFDGKDACQKIHGKIIESDERYGNASKKLYDVAYRLNLNRKWPKTDDHYEDHTTDAYNYGQGFDVPFYIGMINIGANRDKNQWRWSSTGRPLTKNTLGDRDNWDGKETIRNTHRTFNWKLISWAKGANGKKLRGDCAFVNKDAELKEIDCATKLTIICEEL